MATAQTAKASDHAALGRGWTALAEGRAADAVLAVDAVLKGNPHDHRAMTLRVEALSTADPLRALDAYEAWLRRTEDPFLLEPIARATLERIAAGGDTRLRVMALEHLARAGVAGAREKLEEIRQSAEGQMADLALAKLGDEKAAARLIETSAALRGEARVEALSAAGTAAVPQLRGLLSDPAGPVRAAAIRALGRLDAQDAISDIRQAVQHPDPYVRSSATVALARLGDAEASERVQRMLESPVADLRLLAAEAFAGRGTGLWVGAIMPLLNDETGLVRLRAAELLAPVEPEASRAALVAASQDANPVVRSEAVRTLALPALAAALPPDFPALRRALRDADPAVRLHAAGALLELTRRP